MTRDVCFVILLCLLVAPAARAGISEVGYLRHVLNSTEGDDERLHSSAKIAVDVDSVGRWVQNNFGSMVEKSMTGRHLADKDLDLMGLTFQLRNFVVDSFKQISVDLRVAGEDIHMAYKLGVTASASTKLCTYIGGTCQTVMACEGPSSKFVMEAGLDGLLNVGSSPDGLRPSMIMENLQVDVTKMEVTGLGGNCDVIEHTMTPDHMGKFLKENIATLTKMVNTMIATKLETMPTRFPVNELMDIDWQLSGPLTVKGEEGGLRVASRAAIMRKDGTYVKTVSNSIPYVDPNDDTPVTIALHDAVGKSVLQVLYENKTLHTTVKDLTVMGHSFNLVVSAAEVPDLHFQKDGIVFEGKASVGMEVDHHEKFGLAMRLKTRLRASFTKDTNMHPAVQLHFESLDVKGVEFDFNVLGHHSLPLPIIRLALEGMVKILTPMINRKMEKTLLRLPGVAGVSLAHGSVVPEQEYLAIRGGFGSVSQ